MRNKPIIAGNWKMHKTGEEAVEFVHAIIPHLKEAPAAVYIAPPFTAIQRAAQAAKGTALMVGAQNVHPSEKGAFTGEISARMLQEAGAHFIIVGHSERRSLMHEDNAIINEKVHATLKAGLTSILCIGETEKERSDHKTETVLKEQLTRCLEGVSAEDAAKVIIAYEPVWAIGTGKSATPEMAQETHHFCRIVLTELFGIETAKQMPILYGGSVKPETAHGLMQMEDIDGALVGGASLEAETFAQIINHV